jgi:catechol 2,3-dioxygenase-like lactoylglutathione lyase family enzyme
MIMKLGEYVQIIVSTPDLEESLPFYKRLGFKVLAQDKQPNPWAQITDGVLILQLNQGQESFSGLTYFASDMEARVAKLEAEGLSFAKKRELDGKFHQAIFFDPNGCGVSLINADHSQMPKPERESFSKCGFFGEFSIPTEDMKASMAFWEGLGFRRTDGDDVEPYPWAIMVDDLMVVGLHQADDFSEIIITYFAKDMIERIENLRGEGVEYVWEKKDKQGHVAGVRIEAPDGQSFYLFQAEKW